ncbi:hypothetical protein, partial [Streptomyces fructofermentans]|uniref:hypothetical protein n=1 Tax=Streptomyces fructofermentans TaxID=152141 RepID=UPI0033D26B09
NIFVFDETMFGPPTNSHPQDPTNDSHMLDMFDPPIDPHPQDPTNDSHMFDFLTDPPTEASP